MWMTELTTNTRTDESRIGIQSDVTETIRNLQAEGSYLKFELRSSKFEERDKTFGIVIASLARP
jgi:hypothetical protein